MNLVPILSRIPHEALHVYVYLDERATLDTKVGVTQGEISRATRLSVGAVRESLGWLLDPSYKDANLAETDSMSPLISLVKFSKAHKISLLPPYNDGREIRFTFEDTDSRRLEVLENEVRRLARPALQTNRLSLYMRGERQAVVAEIEADLGRVVTIEEAFLLGGILDQFGPERLKMAWRKYATSIDKPIVALYAMFNKQRFGNAVESKGTSEIEEYPKLVRNTDPV